MSPDAIAAIIAGGCGATSLIGSAFISGARWGSVKARLAMLEKGQDAMATKEQLSGVKEAVAEIKGMFTMTLRKDELGMNLTDAMTYVRLALTTVITALIAVYSYYPHDTWIMAIVGVAATFGIHAVPSVSQSNPNSVAANETDHLG